MPLKIVRDDIVKVNADAIVNTSSPSPVIGRGVDLRINNAAGPELIRYREKFGQLSPQTKPSPRFSINSDKPERSNANVTSLSGNS